MKRNEKKAIAQSLGSIDNGTGINVQKKQNLMKYFGCARCTWQGRKECPHGIPIGGHHSNRICSERAMYLKERLKVCGSVPRVLQAEELFKLEQISQYMMWDWAEGNPIHEDFKHISKLIVSLTDKMRRQDEGIKIAGEMTVSHESFKEMVEAEAKKIEERDKRTRQGEFKEEVSGNRQESA